MKKIKESKFNKSTGKWESQPVRYVDFHCSLHEWQKLSNGKYFLVRDFIKSLDLNELVWSGITTKDVIHHAVKVIISDRYDVSIIEKDDMWVVSIPNVPKRPPYPAYVVGIYDEYNLRNVPELYKPIEKVVECDKPLISAVAGVCNAIFKLAESAMSPYYKGYVSGKLKVKSFIKDLDDLMK